MMTLKGCGFGPVAALAITLGLLSLLGDSEPLAQGQPECTVTVQPGQSIQVAIERAQAGAVICLQAGEWEENLVIEKGLTLRAAEVRPEPNVVIKSVKEGWPVILIRSEGPIEVAIIGLKITGAFGGCYQREPEWICPVGISVHGKAKAVIQNNTIRGNLVGIWMWDSSQATIQDNTISDNEYGIVMWGSSQATIQDNTISDNGDDGIEMWGSSQATIQNNTISDNEYDGIEMRDSSQATIENNTISDSRNGIWIFGSSQATIQDNKIVNNEEYGVACYQQPCFDYAPEKFEGAVRGSKNEISGNKEADLCPKDLEFLKTSAGGCYGPKC